MSQLRTMGTATRFPYPARDNINVFVGGREAAEDRVFLEHNNIRFVLNVTSNHQAWQQ